MVSKRSKLGRKRRFEGSPEDLNWQNNDRRYSWPMKLNQVKQMNVGFPRLL